MLDYHFFMLLKFIYQLIQKNLIKDNEIKFSETITSG